MREGARENKEKPFLGDLVIATGNPAKLNRFKDGLGCQFDINLSSLNEQGLEKVEEPYMTARGNARHKALSYYRQCKKPVLSVDEALFLDFLPENEQPGVHVRRIGGGEEVSDDVLLSRVIDLLKKAPREKRRGRWNFAVCLVCSEDNIVEDQFEEELEFTTTPSPKTLPGYPLSRIGIRPEFGKPGSELSSAESAVADQRYMEMVGDVVRKAFGLAVDNF